MQKHFPLILIMQVSKQNSIIIIHKKWCNFLKGREGYGWQISIRGKVKKSNVEQKTVKQI